MYDEQASCLRVSFLDTSFRRKRDYVLDQLFVPRPSIFMPSCTVVKIAIAPPTLAASPTTINYMYRELVQNTLLACNRATSCNYKVPPVLPELDMTAEQIFPVAGKIHPPIYLFFHSSYPIPSHIAIILSFPLNEREADALFIFDDISTVIARSYWC